MKSFYHANATRAKYFALNRWIKLTCLACIICITLMAALYLSEYELHQGLLSQHKELNAWQATHKKLPETHGAQLALTKIQSRQKRARQPVALLKRLKELCTHDSTLESLNLKKNNLQISMAAKNAPTLITIADHLAKQSAWTDLHISALEPKEQRMIATLKSHAEIKNG